MDSDTTAFYNWYARAERTGLLDRALVEYYRDSPYRYRVSVDGEEYALPILTKDAWLEPTSSLNDAHGSWNHDLYSSVEMDRVNEQVERVAHANGDDFETVRDGLFNGECFQPTGIETDPLQVNVRDSDYFTKLGTDHALSTELGRFLFEYGVTPEATQSDLETAMGEADLPVRDELGHNVPTFNEGLSKHTAPFGVNTLLVFNTGDDYRLLVGKRAEHLVVYPGVWMATPAGGVEAIDGELDFEANVLKEYGEEVLSVDEHEADALDHTGVERVYEMMESGEAHLDFTGIAIQTPRLGVALANVLFIDDPEYYKEYIQGVDLTNPEVSQANLVPLDDSESLAALLDPESFLMESMFVLIEGLIHLEREYGIQNDLSIKRLAP